MTEPQDAGKYQIDNDGPVQGQVIGDHATVHQHFYAAQDKAPSSTKPQRVRNVPATPSLSSIQRQNRERLLKRVRATWIEGLLEQSLHRAAWIDLHLQEQPDALENPWHLEVQELDQAPCPLPIGTSIIEVYDKADSELLILGEPGAGKTTLLLELTRTLLERAEKDERLPLPIVFNLSSWAEKRQSLSSWLVEELSTKYQVPYKIGKGWIDANQVLPLLDGLDEVAKEAHSACVQQINDYYQSRLECGSSPTVVCCRSEEYAMLSTRVMLQHAVSILPLTDEQINTYLEQAGEQTKGLRQVLNEDAELHSLARQPLMLNIFTLAYQGATVVEVPTGETRNETRYTIFARYVDCMLKRRRQLKCWKPEQVIRWLTFLAKQMQQHDQTIFSVENLQPTWLSRRLRILHRCGVGLVVGLISGTVMGLSLGLVVGLAVGLVFGLVFGSGLVVGLGIGLDTGITPTEALAWPWKDEQFGLITTLIFGLGLLTGLVLGLAWGSWLVFGFGVTVGLVLGLLFAISGKQLPERLSLSPNTGIWRSGRNGLFFGLLIELIIALIFGFGSIIRLNIGLTMELGIGLVLGLLFALRLGLDAFVEHFILRFFLSWRSDLPWSLVPFLDEATERLLLRKVGRSYIFVHRLLLDYFATLDKNAQTVRQNYAALLRAMGRDEEAKHLEEQQ